MATNSLPREEMPGPPLLEDFDDESQARALVEDYLDHLAANLIGRVASEDRARLKDEAAFHLERLTAHYASQGRPQRAAAEMAIQQYGDPSQIADQITLSLYEGGRASRLFKFFGRANVTAFAIVGFAQSVYVLLLQLRVFAPSGAAYDLPLDPGDMRVLLPWPLPLPQHPLDFFVLYVYPILAPFLIGWLAGRWIPVRPARAVTGAMLVAIIYSFVVGVSVLPQTAGLLLAIFQLAFWLPISAAMAEASLAMNLRRKLRRSYGERHVA